MAKRKTKSKKKAESKVPSVEKFFEKDGPEAQRDIVVKAREIVDLAMKTGRTMIVLRDKVDVGEAPKRTKATRRKGSKNDKGLEKLFNEASEALTKKGGGSRKGKTKSVPDEIKELNRQLKGYKKALKVEDSEASKFN